MCFGSKPDSGDGQGPRPASASYAQNNNNKASVPSPRPPQQTPAQFAYNNNHQYPGASAGGNSHHYQQQQQQSPAPMNYHQQNDYAAPPGPPPSSGPRPGDNYAPPPGPPPRHGSAGDYAPPPGPPPSSRPVDGSDFAAPPGPPPGPRPGDDYAPPPGPPPGSRPAEDSEYGAPPGSPPGPRPGDDYAPPPGPPPSHHHQQQQQDQSYMAPPPGPPPAESSSKPKHDWEAAVPDTSLFPPPPSFFSGHDTSYNNATEEEAEAGEAWCVQHPLGAPINLDAASLEALRAHNPRLMQPAGFAGSLTYTGQGTWSGHTLRHARDSCIIGYPPLYSVNAHSPLTNPLPVTIYYEVTVNPAYTPAHKDVNLALGFTALPYPSFRMPGWHRASLAVHGDDGRKYINDRWGGKDFTRPFRRGETYGIGMTFRAAPGAGYGAGYGVGGMIDVEVFFTREGRLDGQWNLHEETDAQGDLPVTGLEGFHDLSCAIGAFEDVGFDVVFDPAKWKYRPAGFKV